MGVVGESEREQAQRVVAVEGNTNTAQSHKKSGCGAKDTGHVPFFYSLHANDFFYRMVQSIPLYSCIFCASVYWSDGVCSLRG